MEIALRTGSRASGVLGQFPDANLELVKAEGFTSLELRLDSGRLDDAAIESIRRNVQKGGCVFPLQSGRQSYRSRPG
jgi:hypothetical protein